MRHDPRFFTFQDAYLNQNVKFDLQNALLGEEQEEELFRQFALAGLTRNPRATRNMVPSEALEERQAKLKNSHRKNTQRDKRIITSHHKHYFQNRSTWDIDRLFRGKGEEEYIKPEINLQIPERAELARLLHNQPKTCPMKNSSS
ncbi:hypothetical protein BKA60DRAFT_597113 [Fusarium oxysporum]|nr:hypothetical protein BKA60DRAFT_597113 [Fusarium oxysporum]